MLLVWPASKIFILTRKRTQASLPSHQRMFRLVGEADVHPGSVRVCVRVCVRVYKHNSGIKFCLCQLNARVCSSQCTVLAGRSGCLVASVSAGERSWACDCLYFFLSFSFWGVTSVEAGWDRHLIHFFWENNYYWEYCLSQFWQGSTPAGLQTRTKHGSIIWSLHDHNKWVRA